MHFPSLNPRLYAAGQWVAAAAAAALIISVPAQVFFGAAIPGGGLFFVTALLSLALVLPLLLYLRATPPVMLDDAGITLAPCVGRPVTIVWSAIRDVKPYPLLPPPDTESLRRIAVGRRKFVPAQGTMLTSDSLPWTYRAVGWFAGEGFRGAFAVTNRTHAEYAQFKYLIDQRFAK